MNKEYLNDMSLLSLIVHQRHHHMWNVPEESNQKKKKKKKMWNKRKKKPQRFNFWREGNIARMKRKKKLLGIKSRLSKKRKSRYSEGGNNSEYCVVLIFVFGMWNEQLGVKENLHGVIIFLSFSYTVPFLLFVLLLFSLNGVFVFGRLVWRVTPGVSSSNLRWLTRRAKSFSSMQWDLLKKKKIRKSEKISQKMNQKKKDEKVEIVID